MGQNLVTFTTPADYDPGYASIDLSFGTLNGCIIYTYLDAIDSAECFAELFLSSTKNSSAQRSVSLASGSFGGYVSLSWNGNIPIYANTFLVAKAYALFARALLVQITYTPILEKRSTIASK